MNQDLIDDLKQFIAATVSQATANMATKGDIANLATKGDIADMATKDDISNLATKGDIARLEQKIDDGFAGVAEAIEQIHEHAAEREAVVDRRLTRLERALPS